MDININTETKSQTEKSHTDNQELISKYEQQISIAIWIQTIGKIMEVLYLTKIMMISEENQADPDEHQVLQGVWIQTIGQLLEAIGVTKEVLAIDKTLLELEGTTLANIGDWVQVVGGIVEAHAGSQIIAEEREKLAANLFAP